MDIDKLEIELKGDWTSVASSPVAQIGFTIASTKFPLLAIIPILTSTLSGGRHARRVEAALNDILTEITSMKEDLDRMNDSSFKLVNEAILCIPHAVQDKKIEHIKTCIRRAIKNDRLSMHQATFIGRVLRDISVEEADFLVKNIDSNITIGDGSDSDDIALGLRSLGLMVRNEGVFKPVVIGSEIYEFTNSAHVICELFK